MRIILRAFLVILMLSASLSAANLIVTYNAGSDRNDFTGFVGFQFTVGGSSVTIQQLGIRCATSNTGNHTVYIVNGANATVVSTVVNLTGCSTGTFYFASCTSTTLSASTQYFLVTGVTNAGQNWSNDAGGAGGTLTLNTGLAVNNGTTSPQAVFSASLGSFSTNGAGNAYVGLDASTTAVTGGSRPRGVVVDLLPFELGGPMALYTYTATYIGDGKQLELTVTGQDNAGTISTQLTLDSKMTQMAVANLPPNGDGSVLDGILLQQAKTIFSSLTQRTGKIALEGRVIDPAKVEE